MADLKRIFFALSFQKKPKVYVETGTYNGENLTKRLDSYDLLYSIEINPEFYESNIQKFATQKKVKLFNGDSGAILPLILNDVAQSCVIFLDAHYSGKKFGSQTPPMPLLQELENISKFKFDSITIIDDTRLLGKKQLEGLVDDPLYPLFMADWSAVTQQHVLQKISKEATVFRNNYGSLTTGRSDQMIVAKVNIVSEILLRMYTSLVYPIFFYYQLKLYKKIIEELRRNAFTHKYLRKIKIRFIKN